MTKRSYPHLRLVADNREPRTYAQSAPGHSSSQRSFPPDSRSIAIASDSVQDRVPYATLRRCPGEEPQRSANAKRSLTLMLFQNSLSPMDADYHHAVIRNATPNGEFTKWCSGRDNEGMQNHMARLRRANLKTLVNRDFGSNASALARAYDPENPKPSYFSDLLRENSGKSFGEKAARKIEERVGLRLGQLDVPDSPLLYDDARRSRLKDELRLALDDLDRDEQREALAFIRKIQSRRRKRA